MFFMGYILCNLKEYNPVHQNFQKEIERQKLWVSMVWCEKKISHQKSVKEKRRKEDSVYILHIYVKKLALREVTPITSYIWLPLLFGQARVFCALIHLFGEENFFWFVLESSKALKVLYRSFSTLKSLIFADFFSFFIFVNFIFLHIIY